MSKNQDSKVKVELTIESDVTKEHDATEKRRSLEFSLVQKRSLGKSSSKHEKEEDKEEQEYSS